MLTCSRWLVIWQQQVLAGGREKDGGEAEKKPGCSISPTSRCLRRSHSWRNGRGLGRRLALFVILLSGCVIFFSLPPFVLLLLIITWQCLLLSLPCRLSSSLPGPASLAAAGPHALLTACRMDDAEACFILSNRFEVDRIAAVRPSPFPASLSVSLSP